MKPCIHCARINPADARFCMQCGHPLPEYDETPQAQRKIGGLSVFALSILGSILLSLVLVFVFGLPVFFLAGFLPLVWLNRKK